METTVITASIMGPIMLLLGIGLYINTEYYKNIFSGFKDNKGLIIIASIIGMVLGSFLVANHSILESTAALIISIIGWIALLKSSFMIALPDTFSDMVKKIKFSTNLIKTAGIVYISIGLYLTNYAYYGVFL